MKDTRTAARRYASLGLSMVAIAMPACHGAGTASRVAYKPVPTSLRGRPFYVSGYAGADYTPARPRRAVGVPAGPAYVPAGPPAVTVRQGTWDEP